MLRAEAASLYTLDSAGFITTPGPFYLERFYIPHFWDVVQRRKKEWKEKDSAGHLWHMCKVTKYDTKEYPELANIESVGVRDDHGNIVSWVRAYSYTNNSGRVK